MKLICDCGAELKVYKSIIVRSGKIEYSASCDNCGKQGFNRSTPNAAIKVFKQRGFYVNSIHTA